MRVDRVRPSHPTSSIHRDGKSEPEHRGAGRGEAGRAVYTADRMQAEHECSQEERQVLITRSHFSKRTWSFQTVLHLITGLPNT